MEPGENRPSLSRNNTDSYFTIEPPASEAETATPGQFTTASPLPFFNFPDSAFRIRPSDNSQPDASNLPDGQSGVNGINPDHRPSGKRRLSLADFFTRSRNPSFASIRPSSRTASPSPSMRLKVPQSPTTTILPSVSASNIWDEIEDSHALSIEYFNATMKRLAKSSRPEPQSCLDFSLLHIVNIRHLEHLLYAELKWLNEALDKAHTSETEDRIDELPPSKDMEKKYPERLKSIETLLNQYSTAVRNFEDMRKRPVKASYEFTFEKASQPPPQRRPSDFFSSRRRRSGSSKTSPGTDGEAKSSPNPNMPTSGPETPRVFDFGRAATTIMAANRFGRPIGLAQRRAARQIRLSHRSIAGIEDWERDFKLQKQNHRAQREEEHRKQVEAFWRSVRRLVMAVVGGIALILPVVVMTLYEGLVQSLVTTSIATFLFAIFVVWYSDANEQDIVAATAAYAAVLVVFIGTSLQVPPK